VKEPTEHLTTMAESLAVLRERPPEWPPIKNDESKIRAAPHVLTPEPDRVAARLSRGHSGRAGRQSTELTAQSAMPRIAGENAIDSFKWAGSRRRLD
jgi:hypothetical protein